MTFWEAVLLGVVQGAFMFIPVSSTAHLVLVQHGLIQAGSELPPPESPEMILFDLVVHVGTLVSVAVVFRRSLGRFLAGVLSDLGLGEGALARRLARIGGPGGSPAGRDASSLGPGGTAPPRPSGLHLRLALLGLLTVAATAAVGLPLKVWFEQAFAHPLALAGTLTITGLLLWWTDILPRRKVGLKEIGVAIALVVGVAQGLALLPGLSRSGTTIAFALFVGVKRRWSAEYSFFVAIPTILAASAVQAVEVFWGVGFGAGAALDGTVTGGSDLAGAAGAGLGSVGVLPLSVGFVVAALVGIAALYLVLHLLYRARFRYFAYYVWALAVAVVVASFQGWL